MFKLKRKSDGTIDCHKAQLVAKGYHQKFGIDFEDMFSLVVKPVTTHLVISLAISLHWCIKQIDIINAFFHGHLDDEVYMV